MLKPGITGRSNDGKHFARLLLIILSISGTQQKESFLYGPCLFNCKYLPSRFLNSHFINSILEFKNPVVCRKNSC